MTGVSMGTFRSFHASLGSCVNAIARCWVRTRSQSMYESLVLQQRLGRQCHHKHLQCMCLVGKAGTHL